MNLEQIVKKARPQARRRYVVVNAMDGYVVAAYDYGIDALRVRDYLNAHKRDEDTWAVVDVDKGGYVHYEDIKP